MSASVEGDSDDSRLHYRVLLHLYRCLHLGHKYGFLERKMEDVLQMIYTERDKQSSATSDCCATHYEISSGSTPALTATIYGVKKGTASF